MIPRCLFGGHACGDTGPEDPFGQGIFWTRLTEAVPAANIHRQAIRVKQQ
ncbi:hypothetical protein [Halobacillus sp. H74]